MNRCTTSGIGVVIFIILTLSLLPTVIGVINNPSRFTIIPQSGGDIDEYGVYWLTNNPEITPTTDGTWYDVDCSAYIPAGFTATGALLDIHHDDTCKYDIRHPASTDDFYNTANGASTYQGGLAVVGLNSSGYFEAALQDADGHIYLRGFTDDTVTYFPDVRTLTVAGLGGWETVDCSAHVPANANGVFVRLNKNMTTNPNGGLRTGDSTDTIFETIWLDTHIFTGIGLNSTYCIQIKQSEIIDLYLVAYVVNTDSIWNWYTNRLVCTASNPNVWEDYDFTGNGSGIFIFVNSDPSGPAIAEIRMDGSTDDRNLNVPMDQMGMCSGLANGIAELNTTNILFQYNVMGYTNPTLIPFIPASTIDHWSNVATIVDLIPLFYIIAIISITAVWSNSLVKSCR